MVSKDEWSCMQASTGRGRVSLQLTFTEKALRRPAPNIEWRRAVWEMAEMDAS